MWKRGLGLLRVLVAMVLPAMAAAQMERGWVWAGNINYAYQGAYVPLLHYGAEIGIKPTVGIRRRHPMGSLAKRRRPRTAVRRTNRGAETGCTTRRV